jgi:hypothetical protein
MSAQEIIEMIKKLPPEQQAEVFAFGDEARSSADSNGQAIRHAQKTRVKQVMAEVFDRHPELFRKLAQ